MSATGLIITPHGIKRLRKPINKLCMDRIEVEDLFSRETTVYTISPLPNKFLSKTEVYWLLTKYPISTLLSTIIFLLGISLIVLGLVFFAKVIIKAPAEPKILYAMCTVGVAINIVLSFLTILLECTNKFILFFVLLLPVTFLANLLSDLIVPPETVTPLTELSTLAPVLIGIALLVWSYKRIKRKLKFFSEFRITDTTVYHISITVYQMIPITTKLNK